MARPRRTAGPPGLLTLTGLLLQWYYNTLASAQTISTIDLDILLKTPWAAQAGWNSSSTSLPNVTSSARGLAIRLSQAGLTGTLPDSWSQLSELYLLELDGNHLTGSLPSSWAQLSQLSGLDLSDNALAGTLPSEWSNLTRLTRLVLKSNNLEGTLPAAWSSMSNLKFVNMSGNSFTGPLPEAWSNLSELVNVDIERNGLTGSLPASWSVLESLTELHLGHNRFGGALPSSWGSFAMMGNLQLKSNNFVGTLPGTWSNISGLTGLHLGSNNLTGTLPAAWGDNPNDMYFVDMSNNHLVGTLPSSWSVLVNMGYIHLGGNMLEGTLPSSWGNNTQSFGDGMNALFYLNLGENNLTGTLPETWSAFQDVQYVSLADNNFYGSIPPQWGNWNKVLYVSLAHNQLTGWIPLMPSVTYLNMSSNMLLQADFDVLPPRVEVLDMSNNQMSGTLPQSGLAALTGLTVFDVANNILDGPLPTALPPNLSVFNASQNRLAGSLPDSWRSLSKMAVLRLDDNFVTGKLPSSWSEWGSNTINSLQMSLTDARLHGAMPKAWVQQFCITVVRTSSPLVVFQPVDYTPPGLSFTEAIPLGTLLSLPARNASINVTLGGHLQSFDYGNPGSICGIPDAVRNVGLVWGIWGALLLLTVVGIQLYLRRAKQRSQPSPPGCLSRMHAGLMDLLDTPQLSLLARAVDHFWFLASDVVWFVYSQVSDAVTIHQVFKSGVEKYAYALLGILLLPFAFTFVVVACAGVRMCQARVSQKSLSHRIAAVMVALLLAPIFYVFCGVALVLHGIGFPLPTWLEVVDVFSLYRLQSLAETFLNALPQSIIQSKLYLMGNDPNGIHVYIDTGLYLFSVTSSLVSILKTVAAVMLEHNLFSCRFVDYCMTLLRLESLEVYKEFRGTGLTRADLVSRSSTSI